MTIGIPAADIEVTVLAEEKAVPAATGYALDPADAADPGRCPAVRVVALAELPVGVVAPGIDIAAGIQRHAVETAGRNRLDAGHDRHGSAGVGRIAGAQLPVTVTAPGPDSAVRIERQGMVIPRGDSFDPADMEGR